MANRFLNPVQGEYVPQYTPDIIDPKTAIDAAKNKQGRYDLALSATSNDFINPEYVALGENNETAQRIIEEMSGRQQTIIDDLTNDKDVSKAAREIIQLQKDYNNNPDLERLRTNSVKYKEQVGNILKGKNANSNATLLEHYQNQFSGTTFKNELGEYGEVPNAVAGDPLDFATFVPHIKALVAKQGIPLKPGVKAFYNKQGQLLAYDIQTREEVKVDGNLVREATKKFIEGNPMYQAALPTHNILYGKEGNEDMLDLFIDGVGDMMNQSIITEKDNIMQVKAGEEEEAGYTPPQAALDALSYRNTQAPNLVAQNSETSNSTDLEARLNVQKIALTTSREIEESAATLGEAFQSLGVQVADPRFNGTDQPRAFEPINYNLEEAVNNGTNIKQAFMEQGTLQTMNDDLFLTGEELEAIENPTLRAKAYKANQTLLRKNSEAILYNSVKMKQNELLFEAQNGPLSKEEMLSASKLQNSLDTDNFENAEKIVLQYTDLDEKQKTYLDNYSNGELVKSGTFNTPEGEEKYTTDDFSKDVLDKIGMDEVSKYGLPLNDLYAAIKYYEDPIKTNMRPDNFGKISKDPLPLPIPKDKYEQFVSLYENDPSVQNARKDVSKGNYKKYIKTLFSEEKEGSFAKRWAASRDRYDAKVQESFTNRLANVMFRDYSGMSGTGEQQKAWVTTGASTIQSYADGLTKRLEDPGKVMNFLAGGRVYDMATGEDVTMSIQLEEGLRSLVERDFNDVSGNTADGSYAIGNYKFSYGGINNVPDVGNAVMLNVTRKVGEKEDASTESYNLMVTGPEVDQMANFQQVEKYKLMTNTVQGAKYNSEAVGEYNDILNDLTRLMNQTNTNSISKYPAGIADVKIENEGRISYSKKQILVDIIPKPDGLTFILDSYYLDDTGNKMKYEGIITSDQLSLSDIAADIAAQYNQIK